MSYKYLNQPEHLTSQLVLGTMLFGSLVNEDEAFQILDYFFDQGFTHIDTAPIYPSPCSQEAYGLTESIVGKYLRARSLTSSSSPVHISTKFPNYSEKLPYLRSHSGPISFEELRSSLYSSLDRLSICCIDAFFLHWPSRSVNNFGKIVYSPTPSDNTNSFDHLSDSLGALIELAIDQSLALVGVSNETPLGVDRLLAASAAYHYTGKLAIQNPYNLLTPYFDLALYEFCLYKGVSLYAHSPLAFGSLATHQKQVDKTQTRLSRFPQYFSRYSRNTQFLREALSQLAVRHDISLENLALRYVLSNAAVSHVLVGPRTVGQLKTITAAFHEGPLSLEVISEIHQIYQALPGFAF